jgi:Domain of unknown function (DUF6867)
MMDFYAGESLAQILVITGVIGGGAAWLAGRAIAQTWRPLWHVTGYMLLLGCAVRFAHFALGSGTLVSLPSYLADTAFLCVIGTLGWRATRTTQMVTQYPWLYQRTGPLTWRAYGSHDTAPARR